MKFSLLKRIALLVSLCCGAQQLHAQYYTWGSDAPMKWQTVRTPDVRMIYPDTLAAVAQRTLFYVRTVQPDISYGFTHGPMRIPFVMHSENFRSNGLVMYLPKRVEFLSSPAISSYSMPWYKQLVAHEYRHAVQYNNLNRGVIRALSYVLGQQGSTIGLLCMPIWAMEGDAVMSETALSSFGRGLQPSFSMGYRAMRDLPGSRRNIDRWFCGSYRDYTPDHYELGYQICSYAYDRYGENIWNKVARYGSRNPYLIATTRVALGKYYKTNASRLLRETFADLQHYWDSLPQQSDSATPLTDLASDNYTTYQYPLPLGDTAVLALRTDFDRPTRFVEIDRRTGAERTLAYIGQLSTRPEMGEGRVWWTEYRRSKLFEQRVNSQLCYMDLADCKPRQVVGCRQALYPTWAGNSLAWVEYCPDGRYVVKNDAGQQLSVPEGKEIHALAWDARTVAFYVLVTDDSGMYLARIDSEGLHPLTAGAYITLSDLRADNGTLYFGSIASGRDEVHCYDLLARREYRLTTSAYGSFAPAVAGDSLLVTAYDARGYRVAGQPLAADRMIPVAPSQLPENVVNPPRKRWEVMNLDTVRYAAADSVRQGDTFRARRYRKAPNLVNIHSWMPVAFDPFQAVDEHNIDLNLGVTALSQNLLSNTEAFLSYGWNRAEGSLLRLGARYFGLGVRFDLDAAYGGNQVFYSLAQYNPTTNKYEYQKRPSPDTYYSVGLTASLPLYFQRGYHSRQLTLSTGWNYSNGMVAELDKLEWKDNSISNIERIGFSRGLHKLSFGVGFSDMTQLAHRDFAPRWGYVASVAYTMNPFDPNFSDLVSLYAQLYLPGVARHHSLVVASNFQTSIGGYKYPSGYAPLSYRSTRLIPKGFSSADILANNYTAAELNYQLPIWCPEGGIPSILYFKRIRLNVGGDYAQFREVKHNQLTYRRLWSVGGDIVLDINAFRQPASATSVVKISVYHPSNGGVWVGASVGLPF